MEASAPSRRELLALFAVSATLLAYQVWLTRMIAIQHWHHLAPLIIAIALLGFGAAGIVVSLRAHTVARHRLWWLLAPALLTGASLVGGVLLAGRVPLNMLALPWQLEQTGYLALYALCFLPAFFFGAAFVSVCFVCWPQRAGRVYATDLAGGALGALAVLPLIDAIGLAPALLVLALLPLAAGLVLARRRTSRLLVCALVALAVIAGYPLLQFAPAEYKAQSTRQLERGSRLLLQSDGLSRRLTVLDSPGMHAAPGLSLGSAARAPRQWQWFSDGDNPVPLLLPPLPGPDFYRQVIGHAPYRLAPGARRALILQADALWHTWIADAAGASAIELTTEDADVITHLARLKSRQPGGIYPDGLELRHSSPRRYLAFTSRRYDVITLSVSSPEAGIAAAQENYLLTRQGLGSAFDRLDNDGVLAIEVQLHSLPRDTLKLVATVAEVLRARDRVPAAHVAVVRDWRTAVVMASRARLDRDATARLREWAQRHSFDLVALPGLEEEDTNRFHHRAESYYQPVKRLLAGTAQTWEYLFELSPATDDRPFFFRFFRWQSLPQWLEGSGTLWRQHLDWGYLLGLSALLIGAVLAAGLLALPPLLERRRRSRPRGAMRYFFGIGLGFMFVEIGLLQKATLVLDATAVSMSAVLAAMLAGAGIGSLWQQRRQPPPRAMYAIFGLIALFAIAAPPVLEVLFSTAAGWPLPARLMVVVWLIGLISVPMGIPLPSAIERLQAEPPATIAWMWAVNGFASVLGTLGASLIAIHAGLTVLMLAAAGCYLLAAASIPRPATT